jgi:hypothetical protein
VDVIKSHPGPAALIGGALLWYLMERDDGKSYGGSFEGRRGHRRAATYGAWEEAYDWSASQEDEATWTERARGALDQVRTVIADQSIAAKDKIKRVAGHMVGVSGKTRQQLHAQWADLREHAGSYVDARTGEPYDDEYGDDAWSHVAACACLADEQADDSSWSSKAQDAVAAMGEALKNTRASAKEQLRALGGHLSGLVSSGRDSVSSATGRVASTARQGLSSGYRGAASGVTSVADSARHGAQRITGAVHYGVNRSRGAFSESLRQQPLAVGAAFLGVGLLAGLLAPSTRAENQFMGEAADRTKDQVRASGAEALERGKKAAAAVANSAADEAARQGVTPQKIAEKARQAVH